MSALTCGSSAVMKSSSGSFRVSMPITSGSDSLTEFRGQITVDCMPFLNRAQRLTARRSRHVVRQRGAAVQNDVPHRRERLEHGAQSAERLHLVANQVRNGTGLICPVHNDAGEL